MTPAVGRVTIINPGPVTGASLALVRPFIGSNGRDHPRLRWFIEGTAAHRTSEWVAGSAAATAAKADHVTCPITNCCLQQNLVDHERLSRLAGLGLGQAKVL